MNYLSSPMRYLILGIIMFFSLDLSAQKLNKDYLAYIEKYRKIAVEEMNRAGVPASIKLAQGILESGAGKSKLARKANNHFGIKCHSTWTGKTYALKDDDYDEHGKLVESCFRVYDKVYDSYRAHSEFLRDPKKSWRYGKLFELDVTDYKGWAKGLKSAGYASAAHYPATLIRIIELYGLDKLDKPLISEPVVEVDVTPDGRPPFPPKKPENVDKPGETPDRPNTDVPPITTPPRPNVEKVFSFNDVKYVVAAQGETMVDIARRTDRGLSELLRYNNLVEDRETPLAIGQRVYLQPMRNAYRGKQRYHTVAAGQTMEEISYLYAIDINKLYRRNRMTPPAQPATKTSIKLRGSRVKNAPQLANANESPEVRPPTITPPKEQEKPTKPTVPKPVTYPPQRPGSSTGGKTLADKIAEQLGGDKPNRPANPETEEPEPRPIFTSNPSPIPVRRPVTVDGKEVGGKIDQPGSQTGDKPSRPNRPNRPAPPLPIVDTDIFGNPIIEDVSPSTDEAPITNNPGPTIPPTVTTPAPVITPDAPQERYHLVEAGETLWHLSRLYQTTVDELRRLNGLKSNVVRSGARLRVK